MELPEQQTHLLSVVIYLMLLIGVHLWRAGTRLMQCALAV